VDTCSWGCREGLAGLHPALVYPLLGLLIGGFLLWGEMSGKKHVPIEDDGERFAAYLFARFPSVSQQVFSPPFCWLGASFLCSLCQPFLCPPPPAGRFALFFS